MKSQLLLNQKQTTSLSLRQRESLRFLQINAIELSSEIEQMLENNPLLDLEQDLSIATTKLDDTGATFGDEVNDGRTTVTYSDQEGANSAVEFAQEAVTLQQHLLSQLALLDLTAQQRRIAAALIGNIDEQGYLRLSSDNLSQLDNKDQVKKVLTKLQRLDPVGIACRNLAERLMVQLVTQHATDEHFSLAAKVIEEHLDLVAERNFSRLKKLLRVDDNQLQSILELLRKLQPHITSQFADLRSNQISADVIVRKQEGEWQAHLNAELRLKVSINFDYYEQILQYNDRQANRYIRKHLTDAKEVVQAVENRYDTLLLVAREIVRRQQDFFNQGELGLKSLRLLDIADSIGMHESTVSRAVSGKYLLCGSGVHALKYFFSSGLDNNSSAVAMQALIRQLIANEDKRKPMSDQQICEALGTQGHSIARRTVSKYREALQIPSAHQRRHPY